MGIPQWDDRKYLEAEYLERRDRNLSYSHRAFARDLGLSAAYFNHYINGRRLMSEKRALQVGDRLDWSPPKKQLFASLCRWRGAKTPGVKKLAAQEVRKLQAELVDRHEIEKDRFALLADWYHLAIVELSSTREFASDAGWIAKRLNIGLEQAQSALDRLERLGLLERAGTGLRRSFAYLTTGDAPSAAVQQFHIQHLANAEKALREQPFEIRDMSGITVATDPAKITQAKEMIRRFRRELMSFLEDAEEKTAVYQLSIQCFRLDRPEETK